MISFLFLFLFLEQYTPTEVEWYGLSHFEAINKVKSEHEAEVRAKFGPAKHGLRQKLIDELKAAGLDKVEQVVRTEDGQIYDPPTPSYVDFLISEKSNQWLRALLIEFFFLCRKSSWVSKLNPFSKK